MGPQVQELHGTPWVSRKHRKAKRASAPEQALPVPGPSETPMLSPSASVGSSLGSAPHTPPQLPRGAPGAEGCGELGAFASEVRESLDAELLGLPGCGVGPGPKFTRRASHDLFECIEQSKHKRLCEEEARYVFAQVVEAVHYLDSQGITHCDIKDENLVVDADLKVRRCDCVGVTAWA